MANFHSYVSCLLQLSVLLLATNSGCGPNPVTGGTAGVLTTGHNPVPDVQLTVYSADGERVGHGVTNSEGVFELVAPHAARRLQLEPGSYAVTLESVGAPTTLPPEYFDRESTPLRVQWDDEGTLQLDVPDLVLK